MLVETNYTREIRIIEIIEPSSHDWIRDLEKDRTVILGYYLDHLALPLKHRDLIEVIDCT